ncbi:hypothetical protein NKG94_25130 [Micromonospora sp. M12]
MQVMGGGATPVLPPSRVGPTRARAAQSAAPVTRTAVGRSAGPPVRVAVRRRLAPWKDATMPNKPKPETTDDAREQARRALQTSMDTRQ